MRYLLIIGNETMGFLVWSLVLVDVSLIESQVSLGNHMLVLLKLLVGNRSLYDATILD